MKSLLIRISSQFVALLVLLTFGMAAHAGTIFIDFEADSLGGKANGFTSASSPLVHFSDSSGAGLVVSNLFTECNNTQCLETQPDDGSFLIMDFDVLVNSISVDFGNHQPFGASNVQDAVLTLYLGAVQVGQVVVDLVEVFLELLLRCPAERVGVHLLDAFVEEEEIFAP